MTALEKPADISRFKAEYRQGRKVATVNRALGVLRAAINWGRFQDPPLLSTTPFHRFGVTIKARDETKRDRRIHRDEEQRLLAACVTMNSAEHKCAGPAMHDRIIGALETCCRQGEMLRIQNRHVEWPQHQIVIPGANAKDAENRRIPFDPQGRLAPILKRRAQLGLDAFVFGSPDGEFQDSFKTAWESLLLVAYGHETKRVRPGARVDRDKLRQIDLHWHDLRHEGACRLLGDGVDIRIIQLVLGHSDIKTTQRYLNITDEELRKTLTGVWERRRQLKAVGEWEAERSRVPRSHGEPLRIVRHLSVGDSPAADRFEMTSFLRNLVRPARLERATSWFVARRSIQLSYGRGRELAHVPVWPDLSDTKLRVYQMKPANRSAGEP